MPHWVLSSPHWHDLLAVVKGARNGLVYGAKVRFPHALVMTFLFRSEWYPWRQRVRASFRDKVRLIVRATKQHAVNLGSFVAIYKTVKWVLRVVDGDKERQQHAFLAGCIGGYTVFRADDPINNQIVTYLFARVAIGLAKLAFRSAGLQAKAPGDCSWSSWLASHGFEIEATVVWGLVMWLFVHHRDVLQPSLQASMQYLYDDSESWSSLWTLLVHNK